MAVDCAGPNTRSRTRVGRNRKRREMKDLRAMKAGEYIYIAMVIRIEIDLGAPGQISVLPVFATYDEAKAWTEGLYDIKTVMLKADLNPSTPLSPRPDSTH